MQIFRDFQVGVLIGLFALGLVATATLAYQSSEAYAYCFAISIFAGAFKGVRYIWNLK